MPFRLCEGVLGPRGDAPSRGGVSAQNIALKLGGGGHVPAAGATLKGLDLDQAYERVLEAVREELTRAGYL